MYNSYYGLTFNPFDKQQLKEKDHFISRDFTEMTNRLNYLKDIRGIGVFTARPGMGKSYALRCFAASVGIPSFFSTLDQTASRIFMACSVSSSFICV